MLNTLIAWLQANDPEKIELTAAPGLITFMDHALFRAFQGEINAIISASIALLQAWLDLKCQARTILAYDGLPPKLEVYTRACLEIACDAIAKMSNDTLAASANLTDPYEPPGSFLNVGLLSGNLSISDSLEDTARRVPRKQRARDCWETSRLICPDHVWADEVHSSSQKMLRQCSKLTLPPLDNESVLYRELMVLQTLLHQDLPIRLYQFRAASDTNSVVTKRLYLVKCEYRAPFRAYLESFQSVQRAPSLKLVKARLEGKQMDADAKLQKLLETPELIKALRLEQQIEQLETSMAEGIFGFTEMARLVDHRKAKLKVIPGVLASSDFPEVQRALQRLKYCICRKSGPDTSSGIRPILLDLQGFPRDEEFPDDPRTKTNEDRVDEFVAVMNKLQRLSQTSKAFAQERRGELELPSSITRECEKFDYEIWKAEFLDWMNLVRQQHETVQSFNDLPEKIRKAEMEVWISATGKESLDVVKERLKLISADRDKRFEVMKDMIQEVCMREMNLRVSVSAPPDDELLQLPSTSVLGLLGQQLTLAGEALPIG